MRTWATLEFYEALEAFRPLDPASVEIGEESGDSRDHIYGVGELPVPVLEPLVGRSFLVSALESIDDPAETERLQASLLHLVNRVLSAGRLSPGEREAVELATLHASCTLALGLEHVCEGDLTRAGHALSSISLVRLHRVGYTLSLRLARFARMVGSRAACADQLSREVLAALLGRRPFFPCALESPGSLELRPIESRKDLAAIAEHLKALALKIATASALGVDLVAVGALPEPRPELDDYVRTALLRAGLGENPSSAPLTKQELERFRSEAFSNSELLAEVRCKAYERLVALLDAAEVVEARDLLPTLVETWFDEIEESFSTLSGEPDPRFLGGLVCATQMA